MPTATPPPFQKIALINFGGIGDEILFTPVIQEIRRHFPTAHLTLFLEGRSRAAADLLKGVDRIEEVQIQGQPKLLVFIKLAWLLRRKYFDAVLSAGSSPFISILLKLSGIPYRVGFQTEQTIQKTLSQKLLTQQAPLNRSSHLYAAEMYFALAKAFLIPFAGIAYQPPANIMPKLRAIPDHLKQWANNLLESASSGSKILVHPGVSRVSVEKGIIKGWPAEQWAELIQRLAQHHAVFLVGGPDDQDIIREIRQKLPSDLSHFTDLNGQTKNLQELAALIDASDLLVSVDSAPLHIAIGLNQRVVALFGPTNEEQLLPKAPKFKAVRRADLFCRPCLWHKLPKNCHNAVCLNIDVDTMEAAVQDLLAL
ncbi:MAG: glycosyltransferase family 9 protein [Vampirovibrio sp.]|nr:glycosyltransferase family 9 protein [Vampirovibrio sp.]